MEKYHVHFLYPSHFARAIEKGKNRASILWSTIEGKVKSHICNNWFVFVFVFGGGVWIFDRDSITGPHLTMREIVIISILKISQIPKLIRFRISVSILQTTHLTKDWGATGDSRVLGAPLSNTCGLSLEVSSAHCTKWCGTRIWDVDIHHHQRRSTSCTRS